MEIKTERNWICDGCGNIKVHSILNNGVTGRTLCGVCDKEVSVHLEYQNWVKVEDIIKILDNELNELSGNENPITIVKMIKNTFTKEIKVEQDEKIFC